MLTVGRLAQLVRAPRLHRGSRGFESLTAHHVPKINCRQRRWLHSERRGVDVGGPSIWCQTEPLWDFGGIQEQDYRLWSWPFDLQVARVAGQGRNGVLARWVENVPQLHSRDGRAPLDDRGHCRGRSRHGRRNDLPGACPDRWTALDGRAAGATGADWGQGRGGLTLRRRRPSETFGQERPPRSGKMPTIGTPPLVPD